MQLIDEDNPFIANNVIRPEDGKEYSNIVNFLESYGLVKENDYWFFDGDEIVFLGILYALENCFGVQQVAIGNDNVFGDE